MSPSESCMLSRAYEWPLQATFAESSLARRAPSSRPTPRRSTPIATTALAFRMGVDAEGVRELQLFASESRGGGSRMRQPGRGPRLGALSPW